MLFIERGKRATQLFAQMWWGSGKVTKVIRRSEGKGQVAEVGASSSPRAPGNFYQFPCSLAARYF